MWCLLAVSVCTVGLVLIGGNHRQVETQTPILGHLLWDVSDWLGGEAKQPIAGWLWLVMSTAGWHSHGVFLPWTTGTLHGTPVSACSPLDDAVHAKTLQWGSLPYSQRQFIGRIDFKEKLLDVPISTSQGLCLSICFNTICRFDRKILFTSISVTFAVQKHAKPVSYDMTSSRLKTQSTNMIFNFRYFDKKIYKHYL